MNKGYRYSDEFKQEAVNKVTAHSYAVVDVATRLGISDKTLCDYTQIKACNTVVVILESC